MLAVPSIANWQAWRPACPCPKAWRPQKAAVSGAVTSRGSRPRAAVQATAASAAGTSEGPLDGLLLSPGSEGSGWWDSVGCVMPIVLPPEEEDEPWRMWYYGRGETWSGGRRPFLPTGICGYAESPDGLSWRRIEGPLQDGAVLEPSELGLDDVHIGCSDVHRLADGTGFGMLYFGGSCEEAAIPGTSTTTIGLRMRGFSATSRDGLLWERLNDGLPILEPGAEGEWDNVFASWPRILPEDPANPEGAWLMSYHALQEGVPGALPRWAAGVARCASRADVWRGPWRKEGRVLEGGEPGSWDCRGIGTRHVFHHEGVLKMVYEAVGPTGQHALGLAQSDDAGRTWTKLTPDTPIFTVRSGDPGAWDSGVAVGTPWVVPLPDGGFRLYYVGTGTNKEGQPVWGIGAAESVDASLLRWRRVAARPEPPCWEWCEIDNEAELAA